ncbi:type IA DNA topoisomerase [Nitratidesulfovibrio termitidis]|uniref:type IA DNA topoisomerase n=1 Tax=Nitratidesulfovibrio termitidis TaxID=42252 RepID=UPI000426CCC4|nr:type IA DNA topoisomerase [Nitratidesulfovibrio termitidis]
MPKTLIIAEKPSVARELAPLVGATQRRAGFLEGPDHLVSWAVGHLVGIAEPEEQDPAWAGRWTLDQLPMLPPRFRLRVLPETADQFAVLRRLLTDERVTGVINATDAGREGELIFRRIYLMAECAKPVRRLWASDMTEEGLRKSLARLLPDAEKRNLGLASFARAEADWLVGMNYSRLFTVRTGGLVSVGRVQTPVLCLLTARRREIEQFVPQDFWTVEGVFTPGGKGRATQGDEAAAADRATPSPASSDASSPAPGTPNMPDTPAPFPAVWHRPPELRETRVDSEDEATAIADACTGREGVVESVASKAGSQQPPLPFDLTTLQREANTRFGLSAKDTLAHAQALYETHKLITYPRTDSRHLTKELFAEILNHFRAIHHLYPDETMLAVTRIKSGKIKFACVDDRKVTDHHAIIPTARKGDPARLSQPERQIYEMICRRFIAAFCAEAKFATSTVTVKVGEHAFIARGKVFKEKGWLAVEPWRAAEDTPLPPLRKGAKLHTDDIRRVTRQTKAPAHYTDASLLAAMETAGKLVEDEELRQAMKERGLGTPATRAQVIETLLQRGYAGRQGKRLIASDRGMQVAEVIEALLPDVASPELTGTWEKALKDMEAGTATYPQFMHGIRESVWHGVHRIKRVGGRNLDRLLDTASERYARTPDGLCPLCGGEVRETPRGWACSGQPPAKKRGKAANGDDGAGQDAARARRGAKKADATNGGPDAAPNGGENGGTSPATANGGRCPFIIWRTSFGRELDEPTARELLATGRTAQAMDFTSRQGKPFRAHLVLKGGRLRPEFVPDGPRRAADGPATQQQQTEESTQLAENAASGASDTPETSTTPGTQDSPGTPDPPGATDAPRQR